MAKNTTPKSRSSRGKKSATKVEDAVIVEDGAALEDDAKLEEPGAQSSEDSEAVTQDASEDAAPADDETPDVETADGAEVSKEDGEPEAQDPDNTPLEARTEDVDASAENDTAPEVDESPVEPTSQIAPPPPPPPAQASATPLVFGGIVAGLIGFGAAYATGFMNQGPTTPPVDVAKIEASIAAQDGKIQDLSTQVAESQAGAGSEVDQAVITDLTNKIAGLTNTLVDLETRVTALENREPVASGSVDANVLEEVAALRSALSDQEAELEALQSENEAAKQNARTAAEGTLKRAAMTRVHTALETGGSYASALAELEQLGVTVPAILSDNAQAGISSLTDLQDSFPESARMSLSAARSDAAESGQTGGFTGFLRDQLGARSLTPQEGDSADAILSRAEAALHDGRISDAIAELQTLSEVAHAPMAGWEATAQQRADVLSAAQTLSDTLN